MKGDKVNLPLSIILDSLRNRPNLYIIGAGASFPISPTTSQLKERIIPQMLKIGSYPVSAILDNPTFDRVVGDIEKNEPSFYLKLLRSNPDAIEWFVSFELSLITAKGIPPNYIVFRLLPPGSLILNLNLDQYASTLNHYHVIMEPHGRIPVDLKNYFSENDIADFAEYGIPTPWKNEVLLIRPEMSSQLKTKDFVYLFKCWWLIRDVVIIGYSFSRYLSGVDDYETFRFICEMLRHYKNRVILIDPWPDQTAEMIQNEIGKRIIIGKYKWDILSTILIRVINRKQSLKRLTELVQYEYLRAIKET